VQAKHVEGGCIDAYYSVNTPLDADPAKLLAWGTVAGAALREKDALQAMVTAAKTAIDLLPASFRQDAAEAG
jgi:hypothetical protein